MYSGNGWVIVWGTASYSRSVAMCGYWIEWALPWKTKSCMHTVVGDSICYRLGAQKSCHTVQCCNYNINFTV